MTPEKECWSCAFYGKLIGACCCEDSPCYTDFVSQDGTCSFWKPIPEAGNGSETGRRIEFEPGCPPEHFLRKFYEMAGSEGPEQ